MVSSVLATLSSKTLPLNRSVLLIYFAMVAIAKFASGLLQPRQQRRPVSTSQEVHSNSFSTVIDGCYKLAGCFLVLWVGSVTGAVLNTSMTTRDYLTLTPRLLHSTVVANNNRVALFVDEDFIVRSIAIAVAIIRPRQRA